MSSDEVRVRLTQEVCKRIDVLLFGAGLQTRPKLAPALPRTMPRFFFSPEELPDRTALIREHLPSELESTIARGDKICRHKFDLLAYKDLDYGQEIDWHLDAVHGKRAPLKPWFRIRYLDFAEVGDHKVTWELNRHQHLVTLAKAYCFTSETRYINELTTQWYAWHKANPYPLGINWASTLEVAFRSFSWLWVRNLLSGSNALTSSFDAGMLEALQRNGRYIERYLSTYFSPNTHLIGEAVALFFIGTLCPQIPHAQRWQDVGWKIVLEEAKRQVRPDGLYFEQALYYHVYALDFFLHSRILASLNAIPIPASFDATLKRMLEVLSALSQAGCLEGFGDDDGGRLFNPARNRDEHMTDPLALGAAVYGTEAAGGASLTEESLWLFGSRAAEVLGISTAPAQPISKAFKAGGIYLMADSAPAQLMSIDAGPQGTGHSGHGHADALSIRLATNGRRVLVDSGTYSYFSDNDDRNTFRGTSAHNTLVVDSVDQAVPHGPFAWSSIPNVKVERWATGKTFDYFSGHHDGFRRLSDPVLHRRFVFHTRGGPWLVRDCAEGIGTHLLEIFWHFDAHFKILKEDGNLLVARSADGHRELALNTPADSQWRANVFSGRISPAYGEAQAAPVVCFAATTSLPAECFVRLEPTAENGKVSRLREANGAVAYRYDAGVRSDYVFFGLNQRLWSCGAWQSDAELFYCGVQDGRIAHLVMVGGSFAKWTDRTLVRFDDQVKHFEWILREGVSESFCSSEQSPAELIQPYFEVLDSVL